MVAKRNLSTGIAEIWPYCMHARDPIGYVPATTLTIRGDGDEELEELEDEWLTHGDSRFGFIGR